MTRCPNKRCPIITVCKAVEHEVPAMCYYRDSRDMLGYPETRQLMSNPGHRDEEIHDPFNCDCDSDAGDSFDHRRA